MYHIANGVGPVDNESISSTDGVCSVVVVVVVAGAASASGHYMVRRKPRVVRSNE